MRDECQQKKHYRDWAWEWFHGELSLKEYCFIHMYLIHDYHQQKGEYI